MNFSHFQVHISKNPPPIQHAQFSKYVKFHENLPQTDENMGPRTCQAFYFTKKCMPEGNSSFRATAKRAANCFVCARKSLDYTYSAGEKNDCLRLSITIEVTALRDNRQNSLSS